MSILAAPLSPALWLRPLLGATALIALCLPHPAEALDTKKIEFPGYYMNYTDDDLAASGCAESDLQSLRDQEYADANGRAQSLSNLYSKTMVSNNLGDSCRANFQPIIQQINDQATTPILSFFKNGLVGTFIGQLVSKTIEDAAISKMTGACDNTYNQGKSFLSSVQNGGLFAKSGNSYATRDISLTAANASDSNESGGINSGSNGNDKYQSYGDYDTHVNDAELAAVSKSHNNGNELPLGLYEMCGITYGLFSYDSDGTINTGRVDTSNCSWSDANHDGTWDLFCLYQGVDNRVTTTHASSKPSLATTHLDCPRSPYDLTSEAAFQNSINNTSGGAFRLQSGTKTLNNSAGRTPAAPAATAPNKTTTTPKSFFGLHY